LTFFSGISISIMAASIFPTRQYSASNFVESCGAIFFDFSNPATKRVCLANAISLNEWVLVKGRRNINESRKDAAIREVYEETGFRCKLLPVRMPTRATTFDDPPDVPDCPHMHENLTEPFMCTFRELPTGSGVKIIWWFIALVDDVNGQRGPGEETFRVEFFECKEAVQKLTFETDREVLRKAIQIVEDTAAGTV
jgi:8-oxo-dGTP pyrophosphatase MutT (NUDIX family)